MGINKNTLAKRAKELLKNMWTSVLLFRELPVGKVLNPFSEVFLLEHNDTGVGTKYRATRVPVSQIMTPITPGGGKQLISGGAQWSGTGYTYNVSLLTYTWDGTTILTAAPTNVTLDPSDPSNGRFDAIVVDEPGNITVITGTPSPDPVTPAIPENQLLVQYVYVSENTTQPVVGIENIYLNNQEWATGAYNLGSPVLGIVDFESTNNPYEGDYCVEFRGVSRTTGARFQRIGSINMNDYAILSFMFYIDNPLPNNRKLLMSVGLNGSSVGSVVDAMYQGGISRNTTGQWQLGVVPLPVFNATQIDRIHFRMDGGSNSSPNDWRIDYIRLQSGIAPPTFDPAISILEDGTFVGMRGKINFTGAVSVADDPVNERVNVNIGGDGIGIFLNDKVIGGVKREIELTDTLNIPEKWQYNLFGSLEVDGLVQNDGEINFS